MKAYRGSKGEIRLFRPDMNMRRLNNSMGRLFLPVCLCGAAFAPRRAPTVALRGLQNFDGDEMLKCIIELLKLDKAWVPEGEGYSLYVRPTGISTQATLGVGPSTKAEVFTICSPVGPYYPEGFKPVSLFATSKYQRAWPGGTGNTKIGGFVQLAALSWSHISFSQRLLSAATTRPRFFHKWRLRVRATRKCCGSSTTVSVRRSRRSAP